MSLKQNDEYLENKKELIDQILGEIQNHLGAAELNIRLARHAQDELIKTLFNDNDKLFGE